MARTKGSFSLGGTLEILADAPADARLQVKTLADLTASGSFPYKYIGMIVSVEAEEKAYMLVGSDPTDSDNWKEVGGGSSLPPGGNQGQVLTKQSSTDDDADWGDIPHDNTKANSASLAPVETSTTSEHAYTVGNHLMLAGQRYIVTSDIAVGDTLDVSTNIQAVNLEDETGLSQADFADIITPLPGKFVGGINYSTEEQVVGTWIDGKTLYQKTVSCGALPNATIKNVAHGISNYSEIVNIYGITHDNKIGFALPYVDRTSVSNQFGFYVTDTNVVLTAGTDRSNMTPTYVTIQYTKTT